MRYDEDAFFQDKVKLYADVINPIADRRRGSKDAMLFIGEYPLVQLSNVVGQFKDIGVLMYGDMHKFKQYYWYTESSNTVIMEFEQTTKISDQRTR